MNENSHVCPIWMACQCSDWDTISLDWDRGNDAVIKDAILGMADDQMINDGDQNPNHPENRSRMIWFGAHMSSPLSSSQELTAATIVKPLPLV